MELPRKIFIVSLLALGGCAPPAADNPAVCAAHAGGASHREVTAKGTITRLFGIRPGYTSPHEGFLMQLDSSCNLVVRVEVNTDFTGPIQLARGEGVSVRGEYEYEGRGGVIHWTHRATRGSHPGGYVVAGGRIYQ